MRIFKSVFLRGTEIRDLFKFLWKAKMYFLIPFVVILILFGSILIFVQTTGVAPFIYTLF
ncbi:MAG: hypothetical protein COX79_01845 [Candidatus Levybacteria bacterium CG_4_10_14_0_2_um_filter_36_16]|nr:MAG: hypothetical protein COU26_00990 [Candidatus Levybacteria bacterium CG10_big_fil_rev_8_21_14_0_10_36_30]PIZ97574.1 MAG: hypothetical protein COX79_01845 [Candidatus Levybacteria bacterium CG_4_10_14_0_2_um_filter_36_16]